MTRRVFAIIGHPVGQVRSPEVFNALFERDGQDARMVALDVTPEAFVGVLAGLHGIANFGGLVVTVPHKMQAATLAHVRSDRVAIVGAANLLRPIEGGWAADLSDGIGFVEGLRQAGYGVAGRAVAVVGAGGAGLAIAQALLAGGARVAISDLDARRARDAVRCLSGSGDVTAGPPDHSHDIVVNATPVGMAGDPRLPFDPGGLAPGTLVAEAIMTPAVTPLLHEAARRGHPVHEGRHMLDGQVPAIRAFLGMAPDRA
ncbi:shikimate dehydrogenase family protein [Oceaniglobus indicus]|uniref:shikimate dehydrogenase family protein n=1 Tax=Oceaniglobus indicus TaxID=2047749 RepID=UPI000C1971E8|nr:shikimate dehydrogenase [Oceaniglobus indicus]